MAGLHIDTGLLLSLWTLWLLVALWLHEKQRRWLLGTFILPALVLAFATHVTWRSYLMVWLVIHVVLSARASEVNRRYLLAALVSFGGLVWLWLQGGGVYERDLIDALLALGLIAFGYGAYCLLVAQPWGQERSHTDGQTKETRPAAEPRVAPSRGCSPESDQHAEGVFRARQQPEWQVERLSKDESSEVSARERESGERAGSRESEADISVEPVEQLRAVPPEAEYADDRSEATDAHALSVTTEKIFAERLRFSVVAGESPFPGEASFRVKVERDIGELTERQLSGYDDASAARGSEEHDEGFRERLTDAAADYFAGKYGDPVFATVTQAWVTEGVFPETALADVCNRIGDGLGSVVESPLEAVGTELHIPELLDTSIAGIGANLILEPVTESLGDVVRLCEIVGVVVGVLTGLQPLALASVKMLAHDEFHKGIARGIVEAGRTIFGGEAELEVPDPKLEKALTLDAPEAEPVIAEEPMIEVAEATHEDFAISDMEPSWPPLEPEPERRIFREIPPEIEIEGPDVW